MILLLSTSMLLFSGCKTDDTDSQTQDRGFAYDHAVQITSPMGGDSVSMTFDVTYTVGADVHDWFFELDGMPATVVSADRQQQTLTVQASTEGRQTLRMVGVDRQGRQLSEHTVRIVVTEQSDWIGITSPSDGDMVYNPVQFAVTASDSVERIEIYADDWLLGETDSQGLLSYSFTGLDFEREIEAVGYIGDDVVSEDSITITVTEGTSPEVSGFNDVVMDILEQYPTDGSYEYYWPSGSSWLGHPNDIYYLGSLYSEGDDQNRSYCVGLTFELYMRAFEEADRMTGGDGSINGMSTDDLDDFRVLWFIVNLNGGENVDALENYGLGEEVTDLEDAQPGDIVQFWRNSGSGHNTIFIEWTRSSNGDINGLTYWSTQGSTDGIGYNTEYFGSSGSTIDPSYVFIGRPYMPELWLPWN